MGLNYNNVMYSTNVNELAKLRNVNNLNYDYAVEPKRMITNLEFGKVYYIIYEKKLLAFKIKAISVIRGGYLIETPFGLKWFSLECFRLFFSKEHYFKYLENQLNPIEYSFETPNLFNLGFTQPVNKFRLCNSYKWFKEYGKPMQQSSKIFDVLYTENGFVVYYKLYDDKSYKTYQECLQANLDGMEICDFVEEETTIHFHIKTETKPKIHVLRFIEE